MGKAPIEILREARALLASGRWIKEDIAYMEEAPDPHTPSPRHQSRPDCKFCAAGAVGYAGCGDALEVEDDWTRNDAIRKAMLALSRECGLEDSWALDPTVRDYRPVHMIAKFNDAENTRLEDVLSVYDRAIAKLEAEGA